MKHLIDPKPKATIALIFILLTLFSINSAFAQDVKNFDPSDSRAFTQILSLQSDSESSLLLPNSEIGVSMKMGAAKLTGVMDGVTLNAIYDYEMNDFELGFVSQAINALLPGKMTMEFKANPGSGNAMVLFSINL